MEWVVAGEGQEHAKARTQGEEDLGSCIHPHLGVEQIQRERSQTWGDVRINPERGVLNPLLGEGEAT